MKRGGIVVKGLVIGMDLEGIFLGSQDIKLQLPNEYSGFKSIDAEFVGLMRKVSYKPRAMDVAAIDGLQRTLEHVDINLSKIQRALGEYLERQRAAFSRFYFVGDEDLLEIIGNSKEPQQIQRHLLKMFAGLATLLGDQEGGMIKESALGMASREGETVMFSQPVAVGGNAKESVGGNDAVSPCLFSLASALGRGHSLQSTTHSIPCIFPRYAALVGWVHTVRTCTVRNYPFFYVELLGSELQYTFVLTSRDPSDEVTEQRVGGWVVVWRQYGHGTV